MTSGTSTTKPLMTVLLSKQDAEELSDGISDLLCWAAGFKSACGDNSDRWPMGVEAVREMNIRLKSAIHNAENYGDTSS